MYTKYGRHKRFLLLNIMILFAIISFNLGCTERRIIGRDVEIETNVIFGAIETLRHIYTQQQAYYDENGVYLACADGNALRNIGVEIPLGAFYTYSCTGGSTFLATACANIDDDAVIDTWTMNQNGTLTNTINDIKET